MYMRRHKKNLTSFILFFIFFPWSVNWGQCQEIQIKEKIISTFNEKIPPD